MSVLSDALAMLEAMKGGDWDGQFEVYSAVLDRLPERLVSQTVRRLAAEKWRPAPVEILREATRIEMARWAGTARAYPSPDEAYGEIVDKARRFGLHGRVPYPERPNLRLAGPPRFSHPLVARTVELIGGWEAVCTGEANYSEGLSKQVKAVYERQAEDWLARAARALCLPEEEARQFFPRWEPWEVETEWREPCAAIPARLPLPLVPCPPEVRARLAAMGVRVGCPTARMGGGERVKGVIV